MFEPIVCGLSFYEILCYFLIYAVMGYLLEVAYATLELGKFVNRGFLSGPWCPIYGFGVVFVAVTLKPVRGLLPLFIGSVILTTVIEYVTGFILEKFFRQKWWDYTEEPFNLHGYICLKFSLLWGIGCVFVVRMALPFTDFVIAWVPKTPGSIAAFAILALMLTDLAATVVTIAGMRKKLRILDRLASDLREHSDHMGGFVSDEVAELREKYDELAAAVMGNRKIRRLLTAFPQLKEKVFDRRLSDWKNDMEKAISAMRSNIADIRENIAENIGDVRENIGRGINGIRGNIERGFDDVRGNIERGFDDVRGNIERGFDDVRGNIERGFDDVRDNIDGVRGNVLAAKEKLEKQTEPYRSKSAIGGALRLMLALAVGIAIGYLLGRYC